MSIVVLMTGGGGGGGVGCGGGDGGGRGGGGGGDGDEDLRYGSPVFGSFVDCSASTSSSVAAVLLPLSCSVTQLDIAARIAEISVRSHRDHAEISPRSRRARAFAPVRKSVMWNVRSEWHDSRSPACDR